MARPLQPCGPELRRARHRGRREVPLGAPEAAPRDGWWLSTINTPAGRAAITEITTGDLVICQRTSPTGNGGDLVGICVIGMTDAWDDTDTGEREHAACLVPPAKSCGYPGLTPVLAAAELQPSEESLGFPFPPLPQRINHRLCASGESACHERLEGTPGRDEWTWSVLRSTATPF